MLFQDGDIRKELFRCFRELKCLTKHSGPPNDTVAEVVPHAIEVGENVGVASVLVASMMLVSDIAPESGGII
jgi:hypothetical protein